MGETARDWLIGVGYLWRHVHVFDTEADGTRMMDRIDYEAPQGFFAEQSTDLIGECPFDLVGEGHPVGPVGKGRRHCALQEGSHLD